jgi:hypothetical protein
MSFTPISALASADTTTNPTWIVLSVTPGPGSAGAEDAGPEEVGADDAGPDDVGADDEGPVGFSSRCTEEHPAARTAAIANSAITCSRCGVPFRFRSIDTSRCSPFPARRRRTLVIACPGS